MSNRAEEIFIDHTKLIDRFEELTKHRHYLPFQTFRGVCDRLFELSPRVYMLEERRVNCNGPSQAADSCIDRRRSANRGSPRMLSQSGATAR